MTDIILSGILKGFGIVVLFWGFSLIFWMIGEKVLKRILK